MNNSFLHNCFNELPTHVASIHPFLVSLEKKLISFLTDANEYYGKGENYLLSWIDIFISSYPASTVAIKLSSIRLQLNGLSRIQEIWKDNGEQILQQIQNEVLFSIKSICQSFDLLLSSEQNITLNKLTSQLLKNVKIFFDPSSKRIEDSDINDFKDSLASIVLFVDSVKPVDSQLRIHVDNAIDALAKAIIILLPSKNAKEEYEYDSTYPYDRYHRVQEKLPKIDEQLGEVEITKNKKVKDLKLVELGEIINNVFFNTDDLLDAEDLKQSLHILNNRIVSLIEYSNDIINRDAFTTLAEEIKRHSKFWFDVPDEYIAENYVQVVHQIILKVRWSVVALQVPNSQIFIKSLDKIHAILSEIDTDNKKFVIAEKTNPKVRKIDIPDVFEEELAEGVDTLDKVNDSQIGDSTYDTDGYESSDQNNEAGGMSLVEILEEIILNKSSLDDIQKKTIQDLYFHRWFDNVYHDCYDVATSTAMPDPSELLSSILDIIFRVEGFQIKEVVEKILEQIKAFFDHFRGVIKDVLDKLVYYLKELVSSVIAFLKNENPINYFPSGLKNWLKEKGLAEYNPFHVLLAIPLTVYHEFNNYTFAPEHKVEMTV